MNTASGDNMDRIIHSTTSMMSYARLQVFFLFLAVVSIFINGAPIDDNGGEFISVVSEGSPVKCGYQSFGPSLFEVELYLPLKPVSVDQWVNGTLKTTPSQEILSGAVKLDFNFWPYQLRFPFCDLGHGEEYCPVKKDVEISIPFTGFCYSYYILPGHKIINVTAVTGHNEVVARVGVDCTIQPAGRRFPKPWKGV